MLGALVLGSLLLQESDVGLKAGGLDFRRHGMLFCFPLLLFHRLGGRLQSLSPSTQPPFVSPTIVFLWERFEGQSLPYEGQPHEQEQRGKRALTRSNLTSGPMLASKPAALFLAADSRSCEAIWCVTIDSSADVRCPLHSVNAASLPTSNALFSARIT